MSSSMAGTYARRAKSAANPDTANLNLVKAIEELVKVVQNLEVQVARLKRG
ncbi:hypothetical protein LJR220_003358 [Bradyrhizobium sp. LjRoot220]|uniref:hypothetical protein n=1 Tax=Bradyrhizobium sp. LjRoot220 TaxID=3342284 RepID=UPI003ED10937